ncbi:MAG: hypothetical protein K6G38_01635 [Gammaproteobacteria bacterium]|nr:hypothetical protein [Gammaproteobacteria bacterium]
MHKIDRRLIGKYLKDHIFVWIVAFIVCFALSWILFRKWTAYTRDEQVNFAITAVAQHSEGRAEEFLEVLNDGEIKDINLSFFDISNSSQVSEYLLTYGYRMSDIFIIDTYVGASILDDCFYEFSDAQIEELEEAIGSNIQYIKDGEKIIGILVHDADDDTYNEQFSYINEWILFEADEVECDYAIFFNRESTHNESYNFELLKYILK